MKLYLKLLFFLLIVNTAFSQWRDSASFVITSPAGKKVKIGQFYVGTDTLYKTAGGIAYKSGSLYYTDGSTWIKLSAGSGGAGSFTKQQIDTVSTINAGVWQGTSIDTAYTNAVSNIISANNMLTVSTAGKTKILTIDSTILASKSFVANTYVPLVRTISTGYGINGGGALTANLTLVADTTELITPTDTLYNVSIARQNDHTAFDSITVGESVTAEGIVRISDGTSEFGRLRVTALSSDRTYTFPNQSGTVMMISDTSIIPTFQHSWTVSQYFTARAYFSSIAVDTVVAKSSGNKWYSTDTARFGNANGISISGSAATSKIARVYADGSDSVVILNIKSKPGLWGGTVFGDTTGISRVVDFHDAPATAISPLTSLGTIINPQSSDSGWGGLTVMSHGNYGVFPYLEFLKNGGTATSYSAVVKRSIVGEVANIAYDGAGYRVSSLIDSRVVDTVNVGGVVPGQMEFVVANTVGALNPMMTLNYKGVAIGYGYDGGTPSIGSGVRTDYLLEVNGKGFINSSLGVDDKLSIGSTENYNELLNLNTASGNTVIRFDSISSFKGLIGRVGVAGELTNGSVVGDFVIRGQDMGVILSANGGAKDFYINSSGNTTLSGDLTVSGDDIDVHASVSDTSAFTTTATRKAVYISGATADDKYAVSIRNANGDDTLPVEYLSYYAKADSLIVLRNAGTTSGLKFSYIRLK